MKPFEIMLRQCENQAEKLCAIPLDENYIREADIFDNYFMQLKQIIEKEKENNIKEKVKKLLSLMNIFIERMVKEKTNLQNKANNIKRNRSMLGYGKERYQTAFRINRRY